MLAMIDDLVRHKWYADASLLRAIEGHDMAAQDQQLQTLLHHIILANRFWLMQFLQKPFAHEEEARVPETLSQIVALYRKTHAEELAWLSRLSETDLERILQTPFHGGQAFTVAQAVMQVCMHSHGHRAQCATRLRLLGGVPPALDFVLWLRDRPSPNWPAES
jgi:uncharacterized damage-inducible protein DinB